MLEVHSPLGRVLAAGVRNAKNPREVMKESIEEAGRGVAHELERFLTTLGTIASISPLMGLFGTVVGMIEIFGSPTASGNNPQALGEMQDQRRLACSAHGDVADDHHWYGQAPRLENTESVQCSACTAEQRKQQGERQQQRNRAPLPPQAVQERFSVVSAGSQRKYAKDRPSARPASHRPRSGAWFWRRH